MHRLKSILTVFALLGLATVALAQEDLAEPLKAFKPFLGKTWKGQLNQSGEGKATIDISRWERALNGQAIRVLHSVNDGEYGGESIMFWDKQKNSLAFYYFTTAGFYTHGTMKFEEGKFISHEHVTGNAEGVTEVKGSGEVTADGKMISKSQYFKAGKWVEGHAAVYVEDPTAQVVFK